MMQWTERVRRESEERGERKAQRETLANLLAARFGSLDEPTKNLITDTADEETLKRWTLNILSAQTLEDVFWVQ